MKPRIAMVAGIAVVMVLLGIYIAWQVGSGSPAVSASPTSNSPENAQLPQEASQKEIQPNQAKQTTKHMITLKTTKGDIQFETYDNDAPKAVNNFITLAQKGFYNNIIFHRVIKGFMIQGGDPTGTGSGGPGYAFEDELNPATASYKQGYVRGVVAMANAGPNTNGSQFFIMLKDTPLPHSYTIFGKVISGQDVVDVIGNLSTDPGDKPLQPPAIQSVVVGE